MNFKFNFCVIIIYLGYTGGKLFRFDYTYYQEAEGWMKLHHIPANWIDARLRCFREGAEVASAENKRMWTTLMRVMKTARSPQPCGILTGTHGTFSKGDYHSVGGTPLSRMPVVWAPGEPDNADNNEDCLLMLPSGSLADVNCSDVYPYVCYRKNNSPNAAVTVCGTVDPEYNLDSRTGSCYKFHPEPQEWPRAFAACSCEGGHLAIINSAMEAEVLKELFAKHPAESMPGVFTKNVVSVGFSEWGSHGLWMTIHGQTLKDAGFDTFASGQPDNATTGQFCGAIFTNGQLDDFWCDKPCPFICEKKPDSLLPDDDLCLG